MFILGNVGFVRPEDGKWTEQFDSLFAVLNEIGQVLTWKFAASNRFDCVRNELVFLKNRLDCQEERPDLIIIDNCCTWRNKLCEVFGEHLRVRLDLFHAVQRVTSTIPKRLHSSAPCASEFGAIFVHLNDRAGKRQNPTLPPARIMANLEQWLKKWKKIKECGQPLLNEDTFGAVNRLKRHIQKGCLSDIDPSCGTNRNERFHSFLRNSGLSFRRIGPELAEALMTIHIHRWNERQSSLHQSTSRKYSYTPPPEKKHVDKLKAQLLGYPTIKNVHNSAELFGVTPVNPVQESLPIEPAVDLQWIAQALSSAMIVSSIIYDMLNKGASKNMNSSHLNHLDEQHILKLLKVTSPLSSPSRSDIHMPYIHKLKLSLHDILGRELFFFIPCMWIEISSHICRRCQLQ